MKNRISKGTSDQDLFAMMNNYEVEPELSDLAFNEFVKRHYHFLNTRCIKKCEKSGLDEHLGKQIAHDTFERVRKYKSYDQLKININNPTKSIHVWLLAISRNLFIDFFNSEKEARESHEKYEEAYLNYHKEAYDIEDTNDTITDEEFEKLDSLRQQAELILSVLNEKEQAVYLNDLECKRSEKEYLTSEVNKSLALRLNVSPKSITKIRQRGKEKLQKAIANFNKGENETE